MLNFYKIENGKLQIGSGEIIPDGFTEYVAGQEPLELIEALQAEQVEQELQTKVSEAKDFLNNTDKKVLPDYEFRVDDNTLEWYTEERKKARAFIRDNS